MWTVEGQAVEGRSRVLYGSRRYRLDNRELRELVNAGKEVFFIRGEDVNV